MLTLCYLLIKQGLIEQQIIDYVYGNLDRLKRLDSDEVAKDLKKEFGQSLKENKIKYFISATIEAILIGVFLYTRSLQ